MYKNKISFSEMIDKMDESAGKQKKYVRNAIISSIIEEILDVNYTVLEIVFKKGERNNEEKT